MWLPRSAGTVPGWRTGLAEPVTRPDGVSGQGRQVLALILGEAGEVAPALAAWAPPMAAIFLSLGLLLHLEDG